MRSARGFLAPAVARGLASRGTGRLGRAALADSFRGRVGWADEALARGFAAGGPAESKIVELVEASDLEKLLEDKSRFVMIDFYAE